MTGCCFEFEQEVCFLLKRGSLANEVIWSGWEENLREERGDHQQNCGGWKKKQLKVTGEEIGGEEVMVLRKGRGRRSCTCGWL